uniref:ZZ-type domain-containing protein n=1 Tax=Jaculus jaculus TaxID=51337 RepID=A0A8C5KN52_JACJA
MEPQVTLNVTFKNETESFLVSDPENTTWADVEAMVKENEEVSINSQGDYEEAHKMAVKQGNQLQMQVYEGHYVGQAPPLVAAEKRAAARTGKKPLARTLFFSDESPRHSHVHLLLVTPTSLKTDWSTNYLETFREQVVKETVEKLEQKLHEKLVLQKPPLASCPSEVSTLVSEETLFFWHIACSNCQKRIMGVRLCPSYNICEDCKAGPYAHDTNHILLRLQRPIVNASEPFSHSKYSTPRLPAALKQVRLQNQVDKNFLKAEKQRLRAEKKQRKAEVKELKKQLKLRPKIQLWNSVHGFQSPKSPLGHPENLLQSNSLMLPLQPSTPVMPTLSVAFIDENLPDGTHLQPGTKFIKHWRMKNTGNIKWRNLTLASTEKKDVLVPCLKADHVGVVSVEFIAPALEGTYTSHWCLSHKGQQFGPRVWCSIIVDPFPSSESPDNIERDMISSSKADDLACEQEEAFLLAKEEMQFGETSNQTEGTGTCTPQKTKTVASERELYIPSTDLLTAQDLLSFELLDINIVRELERVPHNTPVDTTVLAKRLAERTALVEEAEEDLSRTQFVCETVIQSLTLDAASDHSPPCWQKSPQMKFALSRDGPFEDEKEDIVHVAEEKVEEEEEELKDEIQSQSSAPSEDYIILPECFDTSCPLGDSVYSSALSQPGVERGAEGEPGVEARQEPAETEERLPGGWEEPAKGAEHQRYPHEVVELPLPLSRSPPCVSHGSPGVDLPVTTPEVSSVPDQIRGEPRGSPGVVNSRQKSYEHSRHHNGSSTAGGLVKGALSVAASAYKALFSGPPVTAQPIISEDHTAALMVHLCEMGFCDRQLNLWLLKKHNYNILQVVTELLQVSNNDWYSRRY